MNIKVLIYLISVNFLFFYFFNYICSKLKIYSLSIYSKKEIYKNIPLTGGFFIILNFNSYFFLENFDQQYIYNYEILVILFVSNIFFILGYFDDRYNLRPFTKAIFYLVICLFILNFYEFLIINELKFSFTYRFIKLNHYSLIFTLFAIFVFINALNMFDGINGHTGIYTIFIFIIFFIISKNIIFMYFFIPLLIFLYLNLKDYFFIGNSGVHFLGALISFVVIFFYNSNIIIYSDDIFLIMFLPGIDLIRLFLLRIINKKNPFERDLNHWHHIVSNRFGNKITLIISAVFISFPFIISNLNFLNNFKIIIISIIIYSLTIFLCKKKIST